MASRGSRQKDSRVAAQPSGRLTPGQAPPIGLENETRARENLRVKLSVIQAWVTRLLDQDGATSKEPLVPLSALPRSQRAFNAWKSIDLPSNAAKFYGPFHQNANSTLLKNGTILQDLRDYFQILTQSEKTDSARRKQENVTGLHRRLAIEKTLRGIAENELVRARAEVWRSREELKSLRAEFVSTEAYASEKIERLEDMLRHASTERAELTRTLNKIVGMRSTTK